MDTLWDRTKHAFEKILEEGEKATSKMVESLEELSDAAKARLEKARLERALFKRFAELGSAVYELHNAAQQGGGTEVSTAKPTLEEPRVKDLLDQVASLDQDLKKAESQIGKR